MAAFCQRFGSKRALQNHPKTETLDVDFGVALFACFWNSAQLRESRSSQLAAMRCKATMFACMDCMVVFNCIPCTCAPPTCVVNQITPPEAHVKSTKRMMSTSAALNNKDSRLDKPQTPVDFLWNFPNMQYQAYRIP